MIDWLWDNAQRLAAFAGFGLGLLNLWLAVTARLDQRREEAREKAKKTPWAEVKIGSTAASRMSGWRSAAVRFHNPSGTAFLIERIAIEGQEDGSMAAYGSSELTLTPEPPDGTRTLTVRVVVPAGDAAVPGEADFSFLVRTTTSAISANQPIEFRIRSTGAYRRASREVIDLVASATITA